MADTQRLPSLVQVLIIFTLILAGWRLTVGGLTLVTQALGGSMASSRLQRGFTPQAGMSGPERERFEAKTKEMTEAMEAALKPWRPWLLGAGTLEWLLAAAVMATGIGTWQRKERSRALLRQLSVACIPMQVVTTTLGFISIRASMRVMTDYASALMPESSKSGAGDFAATILRATVAFMQVVTAGQGLLIMTLFALLAWQLGKADVRARFTAPTA